MALQKKNFGNKSLSREIQLLGSIFFLFGFMVLAILVGILGTKTGFDTRNNAAGKVYFVENSQDLQEVLNKAADSDAIFLKVGTYTTKDINGFTIKNKNIRVLGAGTDFVNVLGNNNSYVFNIENSAVKFESLKISGANKDGIIIKNSGQKEVSLKDVSINNNSGNGIKTDSKLSLVSTTINQNGSGIEAASDLNFESSVIQNSADFGIVTPASATGAIKIQNGIFSGNKGKAILLQGYKSALLKNLTIFNNGAGIVENGTGTINVANTIVQNSVGEGISTKTVNSRVAFTNSFGNKGGDFLPATLKETEGNTSIDSLFVSDTDLHLNATSALLNKGITTETDSDGSRIDLGAFGGSPIFATINGEPRIDSVPDKYVKPGELYSYEVKATDPDKDALSYVVLNTNAPKWLKQENNKFSGTPTVNDVGFGGVLLLVTDKKGHNIIHPISINVIPADRAVPTPDNNPTPSPVAGPVVPKINIISPKAGSVISNETRDIKWEVSNGVEIDKFVIKYSDDKENFKTLATLKGNETSYKWDIAGLVPGKYVIKIEATDKSSKPVTISEISGEFEVKVTAPTNNPNAQTITITKNSPADNDSVVSRKPIIFVEFKPDADIDTAKTFIKVNNQNVEYKSTRSTVYFEPKNDLTGARTQVEVKIVTKDGAEASRRWSFSLPVTPQSQDTRPVITETRKILGLPRAVGLIVLGIIILGLLLLILYFIFKLIKTIRQERQGNLEAEFTEYYGTDTTYDPINNSATTQTQQTTTTTTYSPEVEFEGNKTIDNTTTSIEQNYLAPADSQYKIEETTQVASTVPQETTYKTETNTVTNEHLVQENPQGTSTTINTVNYANTDMPVQTTTQSTTVTSNDPVTTTVQNVEEDEFVKSLREKYGISSTDAPVVSTKTETTTTQLTTNEVSDQFPPDPTQASNPPKKNEG